MAAARFEPIGSPLTGVGTAGEGVAVATSNDGTKMAVITDNTTDYTLTTYNVDYTTGTLTVLNPAHTFTTNNPAAGTEIQKDFDQVAISNSGDSVFGVFNVNPAGFSPNHEMVHFKWNGAAYEDHSVSDRTFLMIDSPNPGYLTLDPTTSTFGDTIRGVYTNNDGTKVFVRKATSAGTQAEYIPIDVNSGTGSLTFSNPSATQEHVNAVNDVSPTDAMARFSRSLNKIAYPVAGNQITYSEINADGTLGTQAPPVPYAGTLISVLGVSDSKLVYLTDGGVFSADVSAGPALAAPVQIGTYTGGPLVDYPGAIMRDDASMVIFNRDPGTGAIHGILDEAGGPYEAPFGGQFPIGISDSNRLYLELDLNFEGPLEISFQDLVPSIESVPTNNAVVPFTTGKTVGVGGFVDPVSLEVTPNDVRNITAANYNLPVVAGLSVFATAQAPVNPATTAFLGIVYESTTTPGFWEYDYTLGLAHSPGGIPGVVPYIQQSIFINTGTMDLSAPVGTETIVLLPNTADGYANVDSITISDPRFSVANVGGVGWVATLDDPTGLFDGSDTFPFVSLATTGLPQTTLQGNWLVNFINGPPPIPPTLAPTTTALIVAGTVGTTENDNLDLDYNGNVTADMTLVPFSGITSTAPQGTDPADLVVTSDATTAGFFETTFTLTGDIAGVGGPNPAYFMWVQEAGPVDISTGSPIENVTTPILPGGDTPANLTNLNVTGLPPGVTFNPADGTITVTKPSASPGTTVLTVTGDTPDGPISTTVPLTLTGMWPGPPLMPSTFVGGKYSGEACSVKMGNTNNSIVTGDSADRITLLNDLVSLLGSIIRNQVVADYMDPEVTTLNADQVFLDETGGTNYNDLLNATTAFFVGTYTGNQATMITSIISKYFRQFRNFVKKFYNYTPSSTTCGENETPGFQSRVETCNTSVTLRFNEI